ncbi:porin family protein [Meridianimaribacter flavus]|uniref:Outer membrane protein with beta-barrel domain n=1 Tax=Meridianimaribacter flavus TaxID=571115 RepID=A0ABY2G575_9FLAO|nr:porin family protein [Meridianimaribacter flavus]TDY10622.1 outer membrane protein with beta-barrel domain [Meridianimaribacter flavus]
MNLKLLFAFLLLSQFVLGQTTNDSTLVDSRYREDQFYVSATYNLLANKHEDVSQRGFSSGFHLGFIRDMPINKKRNVAVGLGIGLSANSYNQNLLIDEIPGGYTYTVLDEDETSFSKNKFTTYVLEVPLEFRWRTSDASTYKFWRIYSGLKFGYVFANSTKFKGNSETIKLTNVSDFNTIQYGLTFSAGYDTWNIHFYYALNPIFESSAKIEDSTIDMSVARIGIMFYIL